MSAVLDVDSLAPELDGLLATARGATTADGTALLDQTRRLLTSVRAAPQVSPQPDTSPNSGWAALSDGNEVICWREDTGVILRGEWLSGRWDSVALVVGENAWGLRDTAIETSYVVPDEEVASPGGRSIVERVRREIPEARRRAAAELKARVWTCPQCSWANRSGTTVCAFCGGAGTPWAQPPGAPVPQVDQAPPTPAFRAQVEPPTTAIPHASAAAAPVGAQQLRGNIVIHAVPADRKADVVQTAAYACERAGLGRPDPGWIAAHLERLPMLLCRNVTAAQAAEIQRWLTQAGVSSLFERDHG